MFDIPNFGCYRYWMAIYCQNNTSWHKSLKPGSIALIIEQGEIKKVKITVLEHGQNYTFGHGGDWEFEDGTTGHGTVAWLFPPRLDVIRSIRLYKEYSHRSYDNPPYEA